MKIVIDEDRKEREATLARAEAAMDEAVKANVTARAVKRPDQGAHTDVVPLLPPTMSDT